MARGLKPTSSRADRSDAHCRLRWECPIGLKQMGTSWLRVSKVAKTFGGSGRPPLTGIAADAENVYWTESLGPRSSRIRAVNLNGTGDRVLYTVTATVHGLAIDAADGRLYWTNGWGKVQRGLSNGRYQDVATGLHTPTALAIGGANTTPDPTPAKTTTSTPAANKYDVNGDGTVDVKDSDALIVAVAAGITDAKYDVNDDGKVDINDVIAVTANRNGGAAGCTDAPRYEVQRT